VTADLIAALARRPEILGMVALGLSMVASIHKNRARNGGPIFKQVIHAQLAGMYMLGAVLIIREMGRVLRWLIN
jgi:hypothetical protein